jgi:hypothetical protein
MDELMYQALNDYYKALRAMGYKSYDVVYKLIIMSFIHEITNTELRYYINNNDIKLMQDILYQFIGSTCEISFPTNNRPCCCCAGFINNTEQLSVALSIPTKTFTFTEGSQDTVNLSTIEVTSNKDSYVVITQGNTTVYEGAVSKGTSTVSINPAFTQSVNGLTAGIYRYTFNATFTSGEQNATTSDTLTITVTEATNNAVYYRATDSGFTSVSDGSSTTNSKFTVNVPTSKWWLAVPSTNNIVIENADFRGDWYYDPDNGYNNNFLTTSTITVNNREYTLYLFSHFLPLDMNLEITIK